MSQFVQLVSLSLLVNSLTSSFSTLTSSLPCFTVSIPSFSSIADSSSEGPVIPCGGSEMADGGREGFLADAGRDYNVRLKGKGAYSSLSHPCNKIF